MLLHPYFLISYWFKTQWDLFGIEYNTKIAMFLPLHNNQYYNDESGKLLAIFEHQTKSFSKTSVTSS